MGAMEDHSEKVKIPISRGKKIITRDEVRLSNRGAITTLPVRGCRASSKGDPYGRITYLPMESLWLPLVRRLKVEMPKPWGVRPQTCIVCGKQFFVSWRDRYRVHYRHPLCSDICAAERRNRARRDRRRAKSEERQMGMSNRSCVHCGALLEANRATKHYCSVRCRVAAYRARR